MKILYITGSNAGLFNSLLILLQSFAERLPGQALAVCDFGFAPAQAQFLRELGLLFACPAELAPHGVFVRKAALLRFMRAAGQDLNDYDALVWLDADLTVMKVGSADFEAVVTAMHSAPADLAACIEPARRGLLQVAETFPEPVKMAPFARMIADAGLPPTLPYFSSGLFFCRSATMLEDWAKRTLAIAEHPLFEQNAFNIALHRHGGTQLGLDCEEWQAQGPSLDRLTLVPGEGNTRPSAMIGGKNIKTLHATSPSASHLLIGNCRMTVRDLELAGPYKLLMPEALRLHQLQLLASFIIGHGERLARLGICSRAAAPVAGFHFVAA